MDNQNQQQGFKPTGLINPDQYFRPGVPDHFDLQEINKVIELANSVGYDMSIPVKRLEAQMQRKDYKNYRKALGEIGQEYQNLQKFAAAQQQRNLAAQQEAQKTQESIGSLVGKLNAAQYAGVKVPEELVGSIVSLSQDPSANQAEVAMLSSWMENIPKEPEKSPSSKKTQADVAFEQNAAAALKYADELEQLVKEYGTAEVIDAKASAMLGQLPYKLAISFAKVVDPGSVAREGEVAAAQKYIIPLGMFTRSDKALAAIRGFRKDVEERKMNYEQTMGLNVEENVSPENQPIQQTQQQPQSGISRANARYEKYATQAPNTGE